MQTCYARKPLSPGIPDFTQSGYLGSIDLVKKDWDTAAAAGEARRLAALNGNYQQQTKDPEKQRLADLKGTIAEIGFSKCIQKIAETHGIEFQRSELVKEKPDRTADIQFGVMLFDIKGCAGFVDRFTVRDDKKIIINCRQHNVLYEKYTGYFFVKSYQDRQDIFYVTRDDVKGWGIDTGNPRQGGAYYWMGIPKVK